MTNASIFSLPFQVQGRSCHTVSATNREFPAITVSAYDPTVALRARDPPTGIWLYDLKFDGYRALAFKVGKEVRLISRNQIDFGNDYPQLIDALKLLTAKNVVIDGEIAALDSEGRSSFQLLQS